MELTQQQYEKIEDSLPLQRGNVRLSNLEVLNAILYVAEQGCKWRSLPGRFGNWHTIYVRMNRWAKSGVLDRVFEKVQVEQIVRIKIEAFALDSTSVKVHPDGTGALKEKRPASHRQVARRMEHQDSYGCRECSNGHNVCSISGQRSRRSGGSGAALGAGADAGKALPADGSCLRGRRNPPTGARPGHDSGGSAQVQSDRAVGVRPRPVQETQPDRAALPQAQRLPPHLLPIRETRRRLRRLSLLRTYRRGAEISVNTPQPAAPSRARDKCTPARSRRPLSM